MWFFIAVIGMVVAYVSGRKWGNQLYNYYRPRLNYVLPYIRRKYRPVVGTSLQSVETADGINAKKKFDLDSVNIICLICSFKFRKITILLAISAANLCFFCNFDKCIKRTQNNRKTVVSGNQFKFILIVRSKTYFFKMISNS